MTKTTIMRLRKEKRQGWFCAQQKKGNGAFFRWADKQKRAVVGINLWRGPYAQVFIDPETRGGYLTNKELHAISKVFEKNDSGYDSCFVTKDQCEVWVTRKKAESVAKTLAKIVQKEDARWLKKWEECFEDK